MIRAVFHAVRRVAQPQRWHAADNLKVQYWCSSCQANSVSTHHPVKVDQCRIVSCGGVKSVPPPLRASRSFPVEDLFLSLPVGVLSRLEIQIWDSDIIFLFLLPSQSPLNSYFNELAVAKGKQLNVYAPHQPQRRCAYPPISLPGAIQETAQEGACNDIDGDRRALWGMKTGSFIGPSFQTLQRIFDMGFHCAFAKCTTSW